MEQQHHGTKPLKGQHKLCEPGQTRGDRFGRMFPSAPPLYVDPNTLRVLGAKDGPMQATGPAQKTQNIPVAHIFFGQFIDHDVTLDLTSSFARLDTAEETTNFRTPTLDLDCVYGDGPEGSPYLYFNGQAKYNGQKLLTGADTPGATDLQKEDLARSAHGRAIIGDPRNDENRIISQLQLGMIRFHNRIVEHLESEELAGHELFEKARRVATWHYQWVVVNDYLKALCGAPLLNDIFGNGRLIYQPETCEFNAAYAGDPFIPVEFSVAAYRFGHSMIPQRIQIQPGGSAFDVFGPTLGQGFDPVGDEHAIVHWPQVLDLSDPTTDRADKLDVLMAKDLLELPFVTSGEASLAVRNMLRGQAFRLPCGEWTATQCERPQHEIDKVSAAAKTLAAGAGGSLDSGTPLWLYCLIEATEVGTETSLDIFEKGEGLGPVGGRVIAETLIGLMELDQHSYLGSNRAWSPMEEPLKDGGVNTLLDILTF